MFHAQLEIFSTLNTDKVAVKRPRVLTTVSLSQDLWRAAARKQSFKIDFGWDYCGAPRPCHQRPQFLRYVRLVTLKQYPYKRQVWSIAKL